MISNLSAQKQHELAVRVLVFMRKIWTEEKAQISCTSTGRRLLLTHNPQIFLPAKTTPLCAQAQWISRTICLESNL